MKRYTVNRKFWNAVIKIRMKIIGQNLRYPGLFRYYWKEWQKKKKPEGQTETIYCMRNQLCRMLDVGRTQKTNRSRDSQQTIPKIR